MLVWLIVGSWVGVLVGNGVGRWVGFLVGSPVGILVGSCVPVGSWVGLLVGSGVGFFVGSWVGNNSCTLKKVKFIENNAYKYQHYCTVVFATYLLRQIDHKANQYNIYSQSNIFHFSSPSIDTVAYLISRYQDTVSQYY